MLSIYWGVTDECYYYIDGEFEERCKPEWFDDPIVQEIIADIDTCRYVGKHCQDLLDPSIEFSIYELSTGSKGLIMLLKMDYESIRVWGTAFGDNCSPWLLKIAENRDIVLELEHYLKFPKEQFKAYSLLQKREYNDYEDYQYEVRHWGFRSWC